MGYWRQVCKTQHKESIEEKYMRIEKRSYVKDKDVKKCLKKEAVKGEM